MVGEEGERKEGVEELVGGGGGGGKRRRESHLQNIQKGYRKRRWKIVLLSKIKKQSRYRPEVAQRVPGS